MNQSHLPSVDAPFINQRHHHQPEVPHNHRPWEKCRSHNARRIVSKLKEQVKETKRKWGAKKKKQQTENHIPCRIVDRSKEHEPVVKWERRAPDLPSPTKASTRFLSLRQCLLHTHAPSLVPQTLISSHPITALQRSNPVKNNLEN